MQNHRAEVEIHNIFNYGLVPIVKRRLVVSKKVPRKARFVHPSQ